jgi:hypothetical protein
MEGLASQWANYRDDVELVELLKRVAFVPSWTTSSPDGSGEEVLLDLAPYRAPEALLSWRNEALLEALQGPHMAVYVAPPSMRSEAWHDLLTALGMQGDLDKAAAVRIAKDIEESSAEVETILDENSEQGVKGGVRVKSPAERGRALLRYLRDDDRVFLFDAALCRSLKFIRFVPAQVPVRVESGGFVVLRPSAVCSFDQLMSAQKGHLGFTVLPILDSDISPPQVRCNFNTVSRISRQQQQ